MEIWAAKMDTYLQSNSVERLKALFDKAALRPASINSIEFITFRPAEEYETIEARCQELCKLARALGCDKIVVVPSPTPEGVGWSEIKAESVRVLRQLRGVRQVRDNRYGYRARQSNCLEAARPAVPDIVDDYRDVGGS